MAVAYQMCRFLPFTSPLLNKELYKSQDDIEDLQKSNTPCDKYNLSDIYESLFFNVALRDEINLEKMNVLKMLHVFVHSTLFVFLKKKKESEFVTFMERSLIFKNEASSDASSSSPTRQGAASESENGKENNGGQGLRPTTTASAADVFQLGALVGKDESKN